MLVAQNEILLTAHKLSMLLEEVHLSEYISGAEEWTMSVDNSSFCLREKPQRMRDSYDGLHSYIFF